jgi:Zn-dependent protease with chaperone function
MVRPGQPVSPADSTGAASTGLDSSTVAVQTEDSITGQAGILMKDGKPLYPLSPERRALLSEHAKTVNTWRFIELFSGLLVVAIILFTGLSAKLRNWAKAFRNSYLMIWFYTVLVLVVMSILSFPFDYYRDYHLEVTYGFMNQTFIAWFGEQMLSLAIAAILLPIPVWFFYFVVQRFKRWWLAFSIGALPFLVLFIVIAPVLISPLYNKFEPLTDKQLEREILALASKAGIEGSDLFEVNASKQSSKVSAYVTGLFGTKRIVLYDTLIKGFTYDEIKFVMGHEMGHYLMRHIWWGLGIAVLSLLLMLWLLNKTIHSAIHRWRHYFKFDRLGDIASLPLVMAYLSIFSFFFQPVTNWASRYMEHQSDIFGMQVTDVSGDDAATAFDKLSAYNLSDPDPNPLIEFWFYDHPSLKSRMEFVRQYRKSS